MVYKVSKATIKAGFGLHCILLNKEGTRAEFILFKKLGISGRINVLADPNSKGLYLKMGCEYVSEFPSSIPKPLYPLSGFRFRVWS